MAVKCFNDNRMIDDPGTDNLVKENFNNDCVMIVKNHEISNELGQNLQGWQICPSTKSLE